MAPTVRPRLAVVLMNLGTPDQPTPQAVRRYLRQFLSDRRVIEIPYLLWQIILNLLVLPLRSKRVAKAYASIWQDGDSPMRLILNRQVELLQQALQLQFNTSAEVQVYAAMTYGNPDIRKVLTQIQQNGSEHVLVLPMFPQYSATSTGAAFDAVKGWLRQQRNMPAITLIKDYHQHPLFIAALAASVQRFWAAHGQAEKLLMSFHGIPQPYADKGDPYPQQCHKTAELLAAELGLTKQQWAISFQSRFGRQEWLKPYTSELLQEWGRQGVQSIQVISPAFSADCLETLEELAVENQHIFTAAGGQHYAYIPALNADPAHIELLAALTAPLLQGVLQSQGLVSKNLTP